MSNEMNRKDFLKKGWMGLFAPFMQEVEEDGGPFSEDLVEPSRPMRPPGAIPEAEFLETCHRCGKCVEACPADAIRFAYGGEAFPSQTPVVVAAEAPCVVCDSLACMDVCPSGALKPVPRESIKMGLARVNEKTCFAWNGDDPECQVCFDMCPFKGRAITMDDSSPDGVTGPIVHDEACTGCGVCEYHCPEARAAIIVDPLTLKS